MSALSELRPTGINVLDNPVTAPEKAAFVRQMFDDIAPRYDLLNSVLSAGIHHSWRVFATRCTLLKPGDSALDVCTGTGDWTTLLRGVVGETGRVVGVDFSLPMLQNGTARFDTAHAQRAQGDASRLPFGDAEFEAVTVAFGIRNVAEREKAFREMYRVTRPGGRVVCLEFSQPPAGLFRSFYELYSRYVMPKLGGAISGRPDAYAYLPESVTRFETRSELADTMRRAGWHSVRWVDLTFGLVCVHVGEKPKTAP